MAEHEPRFTEALVVISHLPNGQLMAPSPTATRTQPDKRERVCSVPVKLVDKECPQGAQIDPEHSQRQEVGDRGLVFGIRSGGWDMSILCLINKGKPTRI